jgi:septal ring factor EnvC (AmiA/AmiB activator)
MANDHDYSGILLEEMRESFRAMAEGMGVIERQTRFIPEMRQDIKRLQDDMQTVKAALTGTNHELREMRKEVNDHEHRITRLEAA